MIGSSDPGPGHSGPAGGGGGKRLSGAGAARGSVTGPGTRRRQVSDRPAGHRLKSLPGARCRPAAQVQVPYPQPL
eukprot:482107-Hanusia_phi.AAC.1